MACTDCGKNPKVDCKSYPDAHCINYSGANLSCLGVYTNDRLDSILAKINSKLCSTQSNNTITINAGDGIIISESAEQDIADNPVYTISAVSSFTPEDAQDAVFSSLLAINGITALYDDSHDNFLVKWGGRLTENTTVFSNLNDFFNITFTNLGQFNVDAKNITLSSTETPSNKLVIGSVFSSLETTDGHVTIGNNDIELHAFSGLVRSNSPLYLDVVAHTGSTNKVLVHDTNNVVSYRTIPEIIFDFGGVGVTSVGLSMPSAFTVSNSPVTSTGTLTVTGAGTINDYIDGTGELRLFPTIPTQYTDELAQDAVYDNLTVQNGLVGTYNDFTNSYTLELGFNPLLHNTTLDADYNILYLRGRTVYEFPYQFIKTGYFNNGSGVVSFLMGGSQEVTEPDHDNIVRFGVHYTGKVYGLDPIPVNGYMGDKIGYWLGTNVYGAGSYGLATDNDNSKLNGIFFHTLDNSYTDTITFFGKASPNNDYITGLGTGNIDGLSDTRIMTLHDNGDVQLWKYPSTRNDGGTDHALYVGSDGKIKHGPITPVYTDSNALDAIGNAVVDSSSIDFTYDSIGSTITAQVKVQFLYDTLRRTKVRFRIDDTDAPIAGSSSFTLVDCLGNTVIGKDITFFRERALQFPIDDYTYNISTGLVSVTVPFETGERVEIWLDAPELWTTCSTATPSGADSFLINTTDHLLINGSDKLLV